MRLENAHVVITGASRGVGASIARAVVARGAKVTLLARNEEKLKELAENLGGHAVPVDLSSLDQLDGLIGRIEEEFGSIDVFVNNAAVSVNGEFVKQSAADVRTQFFTNLVAPALLCNQIVPLLVERRHGAVITVSSIAGELATRNIACYSASKGGLSQFMLGLARELRGTPVHVGLVILGEVQTDMLIEARKDPYIAAVADRLGKFGSLDPDDVGRGVARAVEEERETLVMPRLLAPTYFLRQLPNKFSDLLTRGIHVPRESTPAEGR
jgi:short-subunit dehydrogenase